MSDRFSTLVAGMRRLGCTPADAIALAILAVAAAAAVSFVWLLARPAAPGGPPAARASEAKSEASGLAISDGEVIVHVAGAVHEPGLYTLPGGSRVGDAVSAAGGPKPRAVLDGVNLARPLTDGEQVLVPDRRTATAASPAQAAQGEAAADPAGTVNLNQASPADLEALPGIGPVLAERIVSHRDSVGGFKQVGELRDVSGIGEKTFQSLVDLVSL